VSTRPSCGQISGNPKSFGCYRNKVTETAGAEGGTPPMAPNRQYMGGWTSLKGAGEQPVPVRYVKRGSADSRTGPEDHCSLKNRDANPHGEGWWGSGGRAKKAAGRRAYGGWGGVARSFRCVDRKNIPFHRKGGGETSGWSAKSR